jgi:hypothetical protein
MTQQSDFTKQPSGLAKSFPELSELVELFPGLSELAKLFAATAIVIVFFTLVLLKTNALDPKHIELVGGIIAGLALFVGGVWAVLTYANNKRLEFQKNFNERQVGVVLEAASAAGNLIAGQEEKEWKEARARFWELYWGRLVLFEDEAVVNAMVKLGNKVGITPFEKRTELISEVYAVSRALRGFLQQKNDGDWRISFGQVITDKPSSTKIIADNSSSKN